MSEKPKEPESIGHPTLQLHSNFWDVAQFQRKFGLENFFTTGEPPYVPSNDIIDFRIKFMREELDEFVEAWAQQKEPDLPKMADALIDLVYVALGTAHFMRLPWQALWDEVQHANMTKERCELDHEYFGDGKEACRLVNADGICGASKEKHSLRGSLNDVIKPTGWQPPNIARVLRGHGWKCDGNHAGPPCAADCWHCAPEEDGDVDRLPRGV